MGPCFRRDDEQVKSALRGACLSARIRATRWLAMTALQPIVFGCLTTESGMSARGASAPQAGRGSGSSPAFRGDDAMKDISPSLRRHDARREDRFEVLGAVAIGVRKV